MQEQAYKYECEYDSESKYEYECKCEYEYEYEYKYECKYECKIYDLSIRTSTSIRTLVRIREAFLASSSVFPQLCV